MNGNGHKKRVRTQRDYFWVCAIDKASQRPILQGPHNTDTDARQWGFEHIRDGDFEVFSFPTINKQAARDCYKNIILERTNMLSDVFKRAKYPA